MVQPNTEGYWKCLEDLNRRQMSNAETYDKSLLTLSSAFLALSLTFTKDVVPLTTARWFYLLASSWGFFALTIVVVIASFMYGQHVLEELKVGAKRYFIDGEREEDARSALLSRRIARFNTTSGILFILAVVLLTVFVSINVRS